MLTYIAEGAACVWTAWSCFVFLVQAIGTYKIFRYHSSPPPRPVSPFLEPEDVPHVTVIRPVKGLEPGLYECLASAFRVSYPRDKLSVRLCVASRDDPAFPVLEKVVADFPATDARIYVEAEDPVLHPGSGGHVDNLGPNPKIRNISRAYREAPGDIIWVLDCNIWVSKGTAGRMVDKLCGYLPHGPRATPYKFVHQLPLVVDISASSSRETGLSYVKNQGGGRLEEMFMATTHAKFYSAINTVGIAPCIVGKSNMFRRSQLDRLTDPARNPTILSPADAARGTGVDFFSSYICEDHLIGDLFWRSPLPGFANHGLVSGDLAVQPAAGMSVAAYIARRVRWLRVRKWTVIAATLVEPGVESLLCCFYASFALNTWLPSLRAALGLGFAAGLATAWAAGVLAWTALDRRVYRKLHACQSVEVDDDTPAFARGCDRGRDGPPPKPLAQWLLAWVGREVLALPIWTWAVLLGATVTWRGNRFRVRMDMSVVKIGDDKKDKPKKATNGHIGTGKSPAHKGRVD